MPGNDPTLLRMPDIELLSLIGVMCETIDNKTTSRKFDVQTWHLVDSQNCRTNWDPQTKPDEDSMCEDKTNIPDYLKFQHKQIL